VTITGKTRPMRGSGSLHRLIFQEKSSFRFRKAAFDPRHHCFQDRESRPALADGVRIQTRPVIASTRAFTAGSIVMSGGHSLANPSPANFFVASIPIFDPLAISLVA